MAVTMEAVLAQIASNGVEGLKGEYKDYYEQNKIAVDRQLPGLLAGKVQQSDNDNVYGAMGLHLGNTKGAGQGAPVTVNFTVNGQSVNIATPGAILNIYNQNDRSIGKAAINELLSQLNEKVASGELTQAEADEIYIKSVCGSMPEPSKSNKSGAKDGNGNTYNFYNIININITVSANIQAIIDAMVAAFEQQTSQLTDLLTNLVAQLIQNQNQNNTSMQEFLVGLIREFADRNDMNFRQMFDLLNRVNALLQQNNNGIAGLTETITQLLGQVLNELNLIGINTTYLVQLSEENNAQNTEMNEKLADIYDLINTFRQQTMFGLGNIDASITNGINQIMALISSLNLEDLGDALDQIIALLQLIHGDTSQNNQLSLQMINLLSQLGTAVNTAIDQNHEDAQQLKAVLNAILSAIQQMGSDLTDEMQAGFNAVINAILNHSSGGGTVDLTAVLAFLETIANNTSDIADNTEQNNQIALQILAAISQLGSELGLNLIALLNAVNTNTAHNDQNAADMLAILQQILAAINNLGDNLTDEMQAGFNAVINAIMSGQVDLTPVLALLQTIADNTDENNTIALQILAAIGQLGDDMLDGLMNIYNAIVAGNSINADGFSVLVQLIQQGNATLTDIDNKLNILPAIQNTLTNMVGSLENIEDYLDSINTAIEGLPDQYDDTALKQILNAILAAIQQCCQCYPNAGDDPGNNEGVGGGDGGGMLYCPNPNGNGYTQTEYPRTGQGLNDYIADLTLDGEISGVVYTNPDDNNEVGIDEIERYDLETFDRTTFRVFDITGRLMKKVQGSQISNKAAVDKLDKNNATKVVGGAAGVLKEFVEGLPIGTYFIR